jgi:hypothetical protein
LDAKLTPAEEAHARSIGDVTVAVAPVPPLHKPRILVGAVIRKPAVVIDAFLKTLAWQRLKKPAEVGYCFITDFPTGSADAPAVRALLKAFAKEHANVTVRHNGNAGDDYYESSPQDVAMASQVQAATQRNIFIGGHRWTPKAWHRVGALKNEIIQACLDGKWDALWLVDADVLCDPYTLQSLGDADVPIVAGVYWTHWQKPLAGSTQVLHAGPQVWLRHPYQLSGHGYSEADFRKALVERRLLRVWGLGACTLFHRAALDKGVSFAPVPEGLPAGPMSDGEDRHLCERARRLHLPLYADSWPDIWHAYHAAEYPDIPKWLARLDAPRPITPQAPDLVSFKIELLEPIPAPQAPNMLQHLGPQYVRGRLAQLPVLPEIAESLAAMSAGERRIIALNYPSHYPYATLRSQRRMIALTLLDTKAFNLPPVVGEELFQGAVSWKTIDATTLTREQATALEEEAIGVPA